MIKEKKVKIQGINKTFIRQVGKHPKAIFNFQGLGVGGTTAKIELLAPTKKWINFFNRNKITLLNWYHSTFGKEPKNIEELKKQVLFETQRLGKRRLADQDTVYSLSPTTKEATNIINTGIEAIKESRAFVGDSKYKLRMLARLILSKPWDAPEKVIEWANNNFKGMHYVSNTSIEWYIEDIIGYNKQGRGYHEYMLDFDFSNLIITLTQTR